MHSALDKKIQILPSAGYVIGNADERAMVMARPQKVRKTGIAMNRIKLARGSSRLGCHYIVIRAVFCTLASLIVIAGAVAQRPAVRVVIPFDFSASGNRLPAGTYTIATRDGFTVITDDTTGKSIFVKATPWIDSLPDDSKLVFSTYGDQHFLQKILCPRLNMSLEFTPSKPEIRARVKTANDSGD